MSRLLEFADGHHTGGTTGSSNLFAGTHDQVTIDGFTYHVDQGTEIGQVFDNQNIALIQTNVIKNSTANIPKSCLTNVRRFSDGVVTVITCLPCLVVLVSRLPNYVNATVPIDNSSSDRFRIVFLNVVTAVADELRLDVAIVLRGPLGSFRWHENSG